MAAKRATMRRRRFQISMVKGPAMRLPPCSATARNRVSMMRAKWSAAADGGMARGT